MVWCAVFAAGVLAGAVNALTGFGAGIMMMTALPSFFDMLAAPALSTASITPINVLQAWKYRSRIQWSICLFPSILYLICSITAIRIAGDMDLRLLKMALSVFLILLALYLLLLADRVSITPSMKSAVLCSIFSGFCSGWFGIGGPMMALYFLSATKTKEDYVACIQFLFAFTNLVNILYRAHLGIYTPDLVLVVLAAVLGTMVGRRLGLMIFRRIDREKMKKLVYLFLGVAGAFNLVGCL